MEVKFDFSLNHRFHGVVEHAVFRLVLRGIDSAQAISELLWVFSEEVKATAIQRLVNNQLLRADLITNRLSLSDGVLAVIEACHHCSYSLELPDILVSRLTNEELWIEDRQMISIILRCILPGISIDYLAKSLFFSMALVRCNDEK